VTTALQGLSAALLPPEHGGPDPRQLAAAVEAYLEVVPRSTRAALRSAARTIDAAAVGLAGARLGQLAPERRTVALRRIESAPGGTTLLAAPRAVVLLVHGATRDATAMTAEALAHPPARPDPPLDLTAAQDWPARSRCDAIVVGSGAGGAIAARTLARAGWSVVVLEEGRRWSVDDIRGANPLTRWAGMYRDGGAGVALGRPSIALPTGRGVGGSTLVNCGTSYRPPLEVQQRWRDLGFAVADPETLAPLLDEVETTLQVATGPAELIGRNGGLLLAGADRLGWAGHRIPRGAPGCGGCSQCILGCPRNAKYGVHLNALPQACAEGARIVTGARVERIRHRGGRAIGVLARTADGAQLLLDADHVVVAAGALESPPLLRRSGLGRHPGIGRRLAIHPAVGVTGDFADPVESWRGIQQSATVDEFHRRERVLIEATATPRGMGAAGAPGHGRALLQHLAGDAHRVQLGALVGDRGVGRVHGRRQALVRYDLDPDDGARLVRALGHMGRLLLAAGAQRVFLGAHGTPPISSEQELDGAIANITPRALQLAALHPTGTVAAGSDDERDPAEPDGSLRTCRGVVVADASVLPSCPTVNPQVAVMAAALGVANLLVERRSGAPT
jgi:choline dehydrogenase-like flavoprotein